MKAHFIVLIIFFIVIIFAVIAFADNLLLNQIKNMIFIKNKDLYVAQISEDFHLYEKNYSKTFLLNLKYIDIYSFGMTNGEIGFPESYEFSGKLLLQFYYKNNLILEQEVVKQDVKWYLTNSGNRYKEITLSYFNFPLQKKYKKNLSLKVTVLEPDEKIKEFGSEVKVVIGVSATP